MIDTNELRKPTAGDTPKPVAWRVRVQTIDGPMSEWWTESKKHSGFWPNGSPVEGFEQEPLYSLADFLAMKERAEKAEAELERTIRNRDMWNGQCDRQATLLERMRMVLAPFAACVFSDNGEVTIDTSRLTAQHYVAARHSSGFADVEGFRTSTRAALKGTSDE